MRSLTHTGWRRWRWPPPPPREHVLGAVTLGGAADGAELVGQRVGPEVGQQESTEEQEERAVTGAPGRLHLGDADGLHVEVQNHHGEHDHAERHDQRWPGLHLALRKWNGKLAWVSF